ncbi:1055_t:CDS:2, partial [Dentiscutata erythropus]
MWIRKKYPQEVDLESNQYNNNDDDKSAILAGKFKEIINTFISTIDKEIRYNFKNTRLDVAKKLSKNIVYEFKININTLILMIGKEFKYFKHYKYMGLITIDDTDIKSGKLKIIFYKFIQNDFQTIKIDVDGPIISEDSYKVLSPAIDNTTNTQESSCDSNLLFLEFTMSIAKEI